MQDLRVERGYTVIKVTEPTDTGLATQEDPIEAIRALARSRREPEPSRHLFLELSTGTLGSDGPVPGCGCPTCRTLAAGGSWATAAHAEGMVLMLAAMAPEDRLPALQVAEAARIRLGYDVALPSPEVLAALVALVPGVVRAPRNAHRNGKPEPLPVEAARAVSILEVADRLGLELKRVGTGYRGPCLLHGGEHDNFALRPERNRFKCFVCDAGGDAIALWMHVTGQEFHEAVKEIAP